MVAAALRRADIALSPTQQPSRSLDALPADVLLRVVATARDCAVVASCCRGLRATLAGVVASVALARAGLVESLRSARLRLSLRAAHLERELSVPFLPRRAAAAAVLAAVQRSPNGVADLAAAVQAALASVTPASPPLLALSADLVRVANFVCLHAWKTHMRSQRGARALPGAEPRAPGSQAEGAQGDAQPGVSLQQQRLFEPLPHVGSVGVQTGAALWEVQELLCALHGALEPANASQRPCGATLSLLAHHLSLQLRAWNSTPVAVADPST